MTVEPLGDAAFIVRNLPGAPYMFVDPILDLHHPQIHDVNASYDTLGIYSMPGGLTDEALTDLLSKLKPNFEWQSATHEIPVLYDGSDLEAVANELGLRTAEVVQLHTSVSYRCFAVGFCPGFPYLGWLHAKLQNIPRMPTPRTHTPPGSVGITGKQTAVYPLDRPGGWPIIGRTPLTLVDVDDNYFPIRAGDEVTFSPLATEADFGKLKGERL